MENKNRNSGALIGGTILVTVGLFALLGQIFANARFWETVWPLIIIGFGAMFFVGMFAGGKSVSGLAIPGSIISVIGLMLLLQNTFEYFESWSYGWTLIVVSVGLGIFIMGWYGADEGQREAGKRVMKIGGILFLVFGVFFESIFNSWGFSRFIFPVALIALGGYLVFVRSGLLKKRNDTNKAE